MPDPPTKGTVKLRMQNKPLLHSSGMDRSTEHLADLTSGSDGIPFNSIQLSKYGLATGRAGAISWMHGSLAWKGEAISRVTPITYFKHVMSGWTKPIPGHLTNEGTTTARSPGPVHGRCRVRMCLRSRLTGGCEASSPKALNVSQEESTCGCISVYPPPAHRDAKEETLCVT